MVNKIRIWASVLLLVFVVSLPAFAAEGQPLNVFVQVNYCAINSDSGQNDNGSLTGIKARIEAVIYQGLRLGVEYTTASSGSMTLAGNQSSSIGYQDTQIQLRIPFNFMEISKAQSAGAASPPESPLRGMLGYKMTRLSGSINATGQTLDRINANGPGVGIELVTPVDKVSFYALLAYYPRMNATNVNNPVPGLDYYYTSFDYRAGLTIPLSENVEANLGYYGERQNYSGYSWNFSSLVAGIGLHF